MKYLFLIFLSINLVKGFSQNLNFFYRDTIVESNQLRFETKVCVAYKTNGKIILEITNLTDSFKIIDPKDISISDINGKQISLITKNLFVIPPKVTRRCRFIAEGADFKAKELKVIIAATQTSGNPEAIYSFPPFVLDKATYAKVKKNILPIMNIGPVTIKLKNFKYYAKGSVKVWVSVFYTGNKFLGVHSDRSKLEAKDGKTMTAYRQRTSAFYFNKNHKELKLNLKFENPDSHSKEITGEKISFENVFIEYPIYVNQNKIEFIVYKQSESNKPIKEEKEDDEKEKKNEKD